MIVGTIPIFGGSINESIRSQGLSGVCRFVVSLGASLGSVYLFDDRGLRS